MLATPLADLELHNIFERQACVARLNLGNAKSFALLPRAAITNTAVPLSITGNIGVTPAGTITFITAGQVSGTIHTNDATAALAHAVAANVCGCAFAKGGATPIPAALGGATFAPGVYRTATTASAVAGAIITLDGATDANGQWVFQIPGAFTTGANVIVRLINGAKACNVYWVVGTPSVNAATTLGANNFFQGHICAYGAITAGIVLNTKGSWFILPATPIITIAGGIFRAEGICIST